MAAQEEREAVRALGFDRDVSRYEICGERVVSVTEALQLSNLVRFDFVSPDVLEMAAERGRFVHGVTAMQDRNEIPPTIPEDCLPYVAAYQLFLAESRFVPVLVEHVVVNERFRYAGTLDRLGYLNGVLVLIDIKTSAWIAKWVGLQLAGYQLALPPEYAAQTIQRFALRLRANGKYSLHAFRDHSDTSDFLAATRIAQFRLRTERISL